jgi:CBS domain-containing protein
LAGSNSSQEERAMKVREIMNASGATVDSGATVKQAVKVLAESQASDLMVVASDGRFVGVLSEGDLIRAALPRYEEILQGGGNLTEAFEVFVDKGSALADKPIEPLIIKEALTFAPQDDVLKAASAMVRKQIRRLPVVEGGRLVGTISRADVCRAVLGD